MAHARLLPAVAGLETPEQAVGLARALLAAGLNVMEITLRHPAALDFIRAVRAAVPDMSCGAGTVLNAGQVNTLAREGIPFGVSPGYNPEVIRAAREAGLPFIPGVATPGELEQAMALGCRWVKCFPCEPLGGVSFLKALNGPYAHTGVRMVPMGGIGRENLLDYLRIPLVAAVGTSALSDHALVAAGDWAGLTRRARDLLDLAGRA